ncbi:poly(ethylene terephthalate) hydrolase family protein, partial [Streptomyces sp. NPDC002920]
MKLFPPRALMAIFAVFASMAIAFAAPAQAASGNPYQRGPAPTWASITAETGPFTVASVTVPPGSGPGFSNGT